MQIITWSTATALLFASSYVLARTPGFYSYTAVIPFAFAWIFLCMTMLIGCINLTEHLSNKRQLQRTLARHTKAHAQKLILMDREPKQLPVSAAPDQLTVLAHRLESGELVGRELGDLMRQKILRNRG